MTRLQHALFALFFVVAGWMAVSKWQGRLDAGDEVHAVTSPTQRLPNEHFEPTQPSILALEQEARRVRYVPGEGDEEELERFWGECDPAVVPDQLLTLDTDIERRQEFFRTLATQYNSKADPAAPALGRGLTQSEFIGIYADFALREAAVLRNKCQSGDLRIAPFFPLPATVLNASHPDCQLIPHYCAELGVAVVARLERREHPELFDERPRIGALGEEVMGQGQGAVDALRRRDSELSR